MTIWVYLYSNNERHIHDLFSLKSLNGIISEDFFCSSHVNYNSYSDFCSLVIEQTIAFGGVIDIKADEYRS